jgi:hypothetical protein
MSLLSSKSKKTARVQEQLDREQAETGEATGKTPEKKGDEEKAKKRWLKKLEKISRTTLLTVIGVIVIVFGLYASLFENPSLASMGSWSRNHWLWILILAGILSAIVALNAATLGKAARVLQTIIVAAVFMIFIGFPVIGLFSDDAHQVTTPAQASVPPEKMPPQTLRISEANGNSAPVYPPTNAIGYKPSITGNGFETRCVYPDGHEDAFSPTGSWCESGYTSFYVHDTSGTAGNAVTYVYVK